MVLGRGALCDGAGLGHPRDGDWGWDLGWGCRHPLSVAKMERLKPPQHVNESVETMREAHWYF